VRVGRRQWIATRCQTPAAPYLNVSPYRLCAPIVTFHCFVPTNAGDVFSMTALRSSSAKPRRRLTSWTTIV